MIVPVYTEVVICETSESILIKKCLILCILCGEKRKKKGKKKLRWRSGGSNLHTQKRSCMRHQSSPLHHRRWNDWLAKALNFAIMGMAAQS